MKWINRLVLGFFNFALVLPVLGQCISVPISLEERTEAAELIVLGKLKAKQAYWGPNRHQIFTLNIFEVTAYLKGSGDPEVALVTLGGFIDNKGQITTPSLQVHFENEYVLFLTEAGPDMADVARTFRPDLRKMTAYADAQGALTKQFGIFHDLYSEPQSTEPELFNRIASLTGFQAVTPAREAFQAREGITGIFHASAAPITSISPNPTNAGTIANGDFITINGSGFGAESTVFYANANDGGATLVGSGVASDNLSWSTTQVRNKPAAGAGTGTVQVNGQTSSLSIRYAHTAINSNFSGFPEVTRQRYYLANVNGTGGLTFRYNTSFAANTSARNAFERSLETWRCEVLVNYGINSASTTAIATAANDNTNVVTFDASLPAGVLGRATSYFSGSANGSCNLFNSVWWAEELDLQFRPTPTGSTTWNFGPGPTGVLQHDFESVSLHELGHALGLGHTIAPGTVMHYAISNGSDLRTPNANEIAGVNAKLAYSSAPFCFNPVGVSGPMMLLTPGSCALNPTGPDLAVGKSVTDSTPEEGDILTYTITVSNLSAVQATGVRLTDQLPNGVTRTATPPNPSQGSFSDGTGIWTVGTVAGMASATLQLQVQVNAGASSLAQPIVNATSSLMLDQTDPNSGNNVGSVGITVSNLTDLAVTKTVDVADPCVGDLVEYTVTIANNGPARATSVAITDSLPAGVTRTGTPAGASQGSFNEGNGVWTVGTLNDGAMATLTLEVEVLNAGTITNTTSGLTLSQTDSNPANNAGSAVLNSSGPVLIVTDPQNRSACVGQGVTFSVGAQGNNLSYQWFKNGNPISNATLTSYTITVTGPSDAGMYHCQVTNICSTESSAAAVLMVDSGSLGVDIHPMTLVRGLNPIVLNADVTCTGSTVELVWTNLNTLMTFTDNPLIFNNLVESATFEVEVMDAQTLEIATDQVTVLVSQNPDFFDLNSDGCNNLLDLLLAIPNWETAFDNDPNGDGRIDIRDLMHINLEDSLACP